MLRAAVFDMDGLLIDSEPLWQRTERQVFAELGIMLTNEDCETTTGLRIDEVVRHWLRHNPEVVADVESVTRDIVDGVIAAVRREGQAKPGVDVALAATRSLGLRLALASSSAPALIEATLERLKLSEVFEVVHSATFELAGKPDPAVYLSTARKLGVAPTSCVAFEDSLAGVRAAKAANMRCVAIPDGSDQTTQSFDMADVTLESLEEVNPALLESL